MKPVVAIVGRPNVGKSSLFNYLAGERIAIVKDEPGITRDRIYADVDWNGRLFTIIDTGGIEPDSKDILLSKMREQAQIAIDTADVIIFMTDVQMGLSDADKYLTHMYGDYMTPPPKEKQIQHEFLLLDFDMPYREYMKKNNIKVSQ